VCAHPSFERIAAPGGGYACVCPAGRQLDSVNGVCERCAASTYKDVIGNGACEPCALLQRYEQPPEAAPASNVSAADAAASACSCEHFGYLIVDGANGRKECKCPAGAGFDAETSTCEPGAPGTYKESIGNARCTPGAPGTSRSYAGASSCQGCVAGFFGPDAGQTSCRRRCPAGTFSFGGARECARCGRPTVPAGGGNCSQGVFNAASGGWCSPSAGRTVSTPPCWTRQARPWLSGPRPGPTPWPARCWPSRSIVP
jgi:hypothetical protein